MTTRTRARSTPDTPAANLPTATPKRPADWLANLHAAKAKPATERHAAVETVHREMKQAVVRLTAHQAELEAAADVALEESLDAFHANQEALAKAQAELEQVRRLLPVAEKLLGRVKDDHHEDVIREQYREQKETIDRGVRALAQYEALAAQLASVMGEISAGYQAASNIVVQIGNLAHSGVRTWQQTGEFTQALFGEDNVCERFWVHRRGRIHDLVQLPSVTKQSPFWGNIWADQREEERRERERREQDLAAAAAVPARRAGVYDANGKSLIIGPG